MNADDRITVIHNDDGSVYRRVFWCPGCNGPHYLDVGWSYNNDPVRPTFQPSVLSYGRPGPGFAPRCHSFVTDGRIQFLDDCDHALRGQTVDLPPYPQRADATETDE